ncbi:hypothetical protein VCR12J2_1030083 [Vibrio coralliirubri]|uniref:hypothetical protein n=1 Tax=Vibrio coralliirubri TaxID=1516159 RepID=UPI000637DD97|nr:hypothetical protein [Vibrio coralliirubri]CDT80714.1 hypothetical protein VCR12J2_1030083 [Vibrio coralliirubri]
MKTNNVAIIVTILIALTSYIYKSGIENEAINNLTEYSERQFKLIRADVKDIRKTVNENEKDNAVQGEILKRIEKKLN